MSGGNAPSQNPTHAGCGELRVLVDGDACPVKDEVYKVGARYGVPVIVVANSYLRVPIDPLVTRVVVDDGADAADDYIAEHSDGFAVIVTADILLAERSLKVGATVIAPNGKPFTEASIGNAVALRSLMSDLRAGGDAIGGPAPFTRQDRSRFLSALDEALVRLRRNQRDDPVTRTS